MTGISGLPALVLAAGKSSRIHEFSAGRPKPLLELAGRTLLGWNLAWLAAEGVREAWINLHYRADEIRQTLGDDAHGVRLHYSFEPELLGTAGAWRHLAQQWSGTSAVLYGDNVSRFALGAMLRAHRDTGAVVTVALFDPALHAHTAAGGGHAVLGAERRIVRFTEDVRPGTPEAGGAGASALAGQESAADRPLINAGVYLLEPAAAEWFEAGFSDFGRDVFPRLGSAGKLYGHIIEPGGFCLGLDTPDRFRAAERLVADREIELQ